MKKQNGFTLIELVIVIIILGILAATAVPKFVDLQTDARISMLKGAKGALEGGASLTHAQALVNGDEKIISDDELVVYGYPAATAAGLNNAVELSADDWSISGAGGTTPTSAVTLSIAGYNDTTGTCIVTYTLETSPSRPTIAVTDTGC